MLRGNRSMGGAIICHLSTKLSKEIMQRAKLRNRFLKNRTEEIDEIISEYSDVAQTLNSFFSSIVINLKIPEYTDNSSNSENIIDPIIKISLKYTNTLCT